MITKKDFRTELNRPATVGQTFDSVRPVYRLNSSTNLLVEDGIEDVDEIIRSNVPQQLDELLDSLLPSTDKVEIVDGVIESDSALVDKLDMLQNAHSKASEMRVKYGLGEDLTDIEVFRAVSKLRDDYLRSQNEGQINQSATDGSGNVYGNNSAVIDENQENKGE